MQIYADVVFLINFMMDTFVFLIVSKLSKKKASLLRILVGAFVMALLYCLFMFISSLSAFYNIFAAITLIIAGVVITFRPKSLKELAILAGLCHVAAFSLGGVGFALYYFSDFSKAVGSMVGFTVTNFPLKVLLASTCTFYILIKLFSGVIKKRAIDRRVFYSVTIKLMDNDLQLNALLDTGNSLTEPVTKAPVVIAEFDAVKPLIPDVMKLLFYEKKETDLALLAETARLSQLDDRLRLIPYKSIGKEHGMLCGFKCDEVSILQNDKTIRIENAILAIYNLKLCENGQYQCLLGTDAIGA